MAAIWMHTMPQALRLWVAVQVRAQSSSNGAQHNGAHEYDFDLFTIGAGSGGVRAARWAASNYGTLQASCIICTKRGQLRSLTHL